MFLRNNDIDESLNEGCPTNLPVYNAKSGITFIVIFVHLEKKEKNEPRD